MTMLLLESIVRRTYLFKKELMLNITASQPNEFICGTAAVKR